MTVSDNITCAGCGYELIGMPDIGRCPECGKPYDLPRGWGVRKPMTDSQRMDWIVRRIRTVVLALVTLFFVVLTVVVVAVRLPSQPAGLTVAQAYKPLVLGGTLALIAGTLAVLSYLYEKDDD